MPDNISQLSASNTDLRFSLTPERVDAAQRQTYIDNFGSNGFVNSKTAMENVSGSPTVMDTVSASATAMDAVSVSDTALDAIWASSTAWDIVKAKSMAVGKFAVGRAGLDGANYTDIDDVASTQAAMDAVSVSTVAMEAVAASSLAMDAVIASDDIALPTVVETETAMDAVSASQTAMDAVAGSQTAMDAVAASIDARSATFESSYAIDSLWASTPGAKTILETGSPALPHDYGYMTVRIEDGSDISLPGSAQTALELDTTDSNYQNTRQGLALELDLSNSSSMEFQSRADGASSSSEKHGVMIDGSVAVAHGGDFGWASRTVDISGYNDTHTVEFFSRDDYDNGRNYQGYFTNLNLV